MTGKLTDNDVSGQGISRETITFTGTGTSNLASVTTNTDGTFTATGTAPTTVNSGWTVQAHFAGDSYDKASDSEIQSYSTLVNTVQHTSALALNSIINSPWGTKVTVTGKLTDTSSGGGTSIGIRGKTITFTSPNSSPLPPPVTTNTDGTFSSSFAAASTVYTGWQLQAHYSADSNYTGSDSTIQSYSTIKHTVSLTAAAASSSVPWSRPTSFTATLTDSSNAAAPIGGQPIHFDGTGVIGITSDPVTGSTTGKATTAGASPSTIATGWTYQAHYVGNGLYNSKDSSIKSYNTVKHNTGLSLNISPTSVSGGAPYKVSGTLTDTTTSTVLSGMPISFTATSPITISGTTTSTIGQYSLSGLKAPNTAGTYNIQAHFAGASLYNSKDTSLKTLTVTTSTTTSTPATATIGSAATPATSSSPLISSSAPSSSTTTSPAAPQSSAASGIVTNAPLTGPTAAGAYGTTSNKASSLVPSTPQEWQQQQQQQQQHVNQSPAPMANAGISQTVNEGNLVALDGRGSYAPTGGIVVAYQWTQLATGIPVTLAGPNTASPTFIAPAVPTDNTVLAFSLRVMDNHGAVSTNPSIVYIMVKHSPNNIGITGGNTPGTTIIQPQQQQQLQPIVPHNNAISPPSQLNSAPSTSPQIGSPNTQNTVPPPRIP